MFDEASTTVIGFHLFCDRDMQKTIQISFQYVLAKGSNIQKVCSDSNEMIHSKHARNKQAGFRETNYMWMNHSEDQEVELVIHQKY